MAQYYAELESETDWGRLESMTDDDVDLSDIPAISPDFWASASGAKIRRQQPITLRIDSDVLAWFKVHGKGYQSRINAALRTYMESQTSA